MARIRSIKPEFWTSEQIANLSPTARLLFIGVWTFSDDGGVHPASMMRLKMEVFPADKCSLAQIAGWVEEIIGQGLMGEFSSQGRMYWHVTGWENHQKIDKPTRRHPGPFDDGSESSRREVDEPSPPESSGEESSGEDVQEACTSDLHDSHTQTPEEQSWDLFWNTAVRKTGKQRALNAWKEALERIKRDRRVLMSEARKWLQGRWEAYNASPKANGTFSWHPATWLNGGNYDDDDAQWQDDGRSESNQQPCVGIDPAKFRKGGTT